MVFWDLGGQQGLRVIWDKYFSDAHALIYVLDASNVKRMDEAQKELESMLRHKDLADAPLLVLANKQDLDESLTADEVWKLLDVRFGSRLVHFLPISAMKGRGIEQMMKWLLDILPSSARTIRMGAEQV